MLLEGIKEKIAWFIESCDLKLTKYGKLIDNYLDRQTARKKYICEVLLTIPVFFLLHQWHHVAPYSNYKIVNTIFQILKIIGSLMLTGVINLTIRTKVRVNVFLIMDIMVAWVTLINYQTFQQVRYQECDEGCLFVWTDFTKHYKVVFYLLTYLERLFIWNRSFENRQLVTAINKMFMVSLITDVLNSADFFPYLMQELSYWLHMTMFILMFAYDVCYSQNIDEKMIAAKIGELRHIAEDEDTNEEVKNECIAKINALTPRLRYRNMGSVQYRLPNLPESWFLRDNLLVFLTVYFVAILAFEIIVHNHSVIDMVNAGFLVQIFGRYFTSCVILISFSAVFGLLANLFTACTLTFLTCELQITEVMNENTCGLIHTISFLTLIESNILNLVEIDRANTLKVVCLFMLYVTLFYNLKLIEDRIMFAVTARASLLSSFYMRFTILAGLFVTVPALLTFYAAQNLRTEFQPLFLAVNNHNLIILACFTILESFLLGLKWYTTRFQSLIDKLTSYSCLIKIFMLLIGTVVNAFYSYTCPYFQSWWFLRFVCIIGGLGFSIAVVYKNEWQRYKTYRQIVIFPDFYHETNTDNDRQDCAICYTELSHGKMLPCNHVFHSKCLQDWFNVRRVCPMCNTAV